MNTFKILKHIGKVLQKCYFVVRNQGRRASGDAQPLSIEPSAIDSFKNILKSNTADTTKVHALYWLSRVKTLSNAGESVELANKGLDLAKKIKFPMGELECWRRFLSAMLLLLHLKKALIQPMKSTTAAVVIAYFNIFKKHLI